MRHPDAIRPGLRVTRIGTVRRRCKPGRRDLETDGREHGSGPAVCCERPGTNGIAFDHNGNLWTGDGTTGEGRVWKITPEGAVTEVFRVQPMRNNTALGGTVGGDGVGRQASDLPSGDTDHNRRSKRDAQTLVTPPGGQDLVANGIAINRRGDLFVADTARGAIWKAEFDHDGNLTSPTGCDTTFTANTLCLSNIFVAHPLLEGTDGIALDRSGNIWNAANERNAIVVVTKDREVIEVFRNPANAAGLRNSADPSVGDNHILEFPTSPLLARKMFCVANSDGNRRDNSPNTAGEISSGGAIGARRGRSVHQPTSADRRDALAGALIRGAPRLQVRRVAL